MSRLALPCVLLLGISFLVGCTPPDEMEPWRPPELRKDYGRPLPPGRLALRKIDPKDYPDFSPGFDNAAGLAEAIRNSLAYLAKPSSRRYFPYGDITHERAVASLEAFLHVVQRVRSGDELNEIVRRDFDVYQSVGWDGSGVVFFTGYYCPIFDGRRQREGRFAHPLYRLPDDLVKDEEGNTLGRRRADESIAPGKYLTRQEIEKDGRLRGKEIAWVDDPFKAYVITVQGSAKLRQPDGSLYEIGYAANNGYDYTPVAMVMINDGVISRDALSLQTLLEYFARHPESVSRYCWQNNRYVFFKEAPGGPYGSINVPVIPYRSIATDKQVFPRACLAFLDTSVPTRSGERITPAKFGSFGLDQDTGGAIRAAGRCDIYMGQGPAAEALAGRTGAEGKLYYLFVKQ